MNKKNCRTDTDANRTVNHKPIKVMSLQDRCVEFKRILTQPKPNALAQAKLERYHELLQQWQAGYTEEELDNMPEDEYASHQSRLEIQAGFVNTGECLEAFMFFHDIRVEIVDTRDEHPKPVGGNC